MKNVSGPVLIGMRGTGKSTIAPRTAARLGFSVIDADAEIERRSGMTIREMFEKHGEEYFRRIEREVLTDLLSRKDTVLSLGGGAVLHPAVREILKTRATVWLHAPMKVLSRRVSGSNRPSLSGKPIHEELSAIFEARRALYEECASLKLDTSTCSPDKAAEKVAVFFREWVGKNEGFQN